MKVMLGAARKSVREITRKVRALSNNSIEKEAISLLKRVAPPRIRIDEAQGYCTFSSQDLGVGDRVARIAALSHDWKNKPARTTADKPFLINILRSQDLFDIPEVLNVALHDEVLGSVSEYLGQIPWLVSINVWWTQPNQTAMRSQLYHYDHRDTRQAKLFINLNNVGPDSGPLNFLPAQSSLKVNKVVGYSQGRYTDEEVYSACSPGEVQSTVGAAGSAFFVDTARCLHYGSRENKFERLVLMVSFARVNCVDKGGGCDVVDPVRQRIIAENYRNDPVRAFALHAQN